MVLAGGIIVTYKLTNRTHVSPVKMLAKDKKRQFFFKARQCELKKKRESQRQVIVTTNAHQVIVKVT